jgi:hypothetical protein
LSLNCGAAPRGEDFRRAAGGAALANRASGACRFEAGQTKACFESATEIVGTVFVLWESALTQWRDREVNDGPSSGCRRAFEEATRARSPSQNWLALEAAGKNSPGTGSGFAADGVGSCVRYASRDGSAGMGRALCFQVARHDGKTAVRGSIGDQWLLRCGCRLHHAPLMADAYAVVGGVFTGLAWRLVNPLPGALALFNGL